jgi:hypothetical protein
VIPDAFAAGFGYGDGTIDDRGRARVRLCGEKDAAFLPVLVAAAPASVMSPPSFGDDTLVVFHRGNLVDWKTLPDGGADLGWLANWLEGLLAADGWSDGEAVVLEIQDGDAIEFVKKIAPLAGYMVVGHHVKSNNETNFGPRSRPLHALKLRRSGVWRVASVESTGEATTVYCAVEPTTGTFVLEHGIVTGNCPFVTIPGSGFQQSFMGLDAILVRYLARKAKRLARKWGGQCIVFIDEIDAVGMRRQSLGGGEVAGAFQEPTFERAGDLVLETRAWRERVFAERAPERTGPGRVDTIMNQLFPGMSGMGGGLALNQLLVVMDGLDAPPLGRRLLTSFVNTFLDAIYLVPLRVGETVLRLAPPPPRREQIYFIGATNVPIGQLDPALTRPGRMGRHVWFRTPTKQDRMDIFELYLGKVSHHEDLDRPERRDELARMTMGYSPAMIEQVCSMALTIAHHSGRDAFTWDEIVEAMTTVESGTAVNIDYVPDETRAVAIHEAGHAVAAHAYLEGAESTRLSIRRRGASLGHHMALQKDERFSSWRSEEIARLVWALGAMAAERVFYGENSTGVGGDVQAATDRAAWMVGACGMAPEYVEIERCDAGSEDEARERIMKRFQKIGTQIINRTRSGGGMHTDPMGAVLSDPGQRAMVEQLLGQAYLKAHHLMAANRSAVERVADALVARKELHGDEVVHLLDAQQIAVPDVDLTKETAWPPL